MDWIADTLRANPALAIFLTLGLGFIIGQLKYKSFSLGNVTSVLLVGVLIGQLDISIPGPIKDAFFLLFLFAIGYSVGPQFFAAMRGDGLKQVLFAVVICVVCLLVTWGLAVIMGYNAGEAAGLMAGAQTVSAVIGVGSDTISSLPGSSAEHQSMIDMIPVCYAVTYVFGTIGSAYILANLGPMMLGGIKKVKQETAELEKQMNASSEADNPEMIDAARPVAFRAYKVEADFFKDMPTVKGVEAYLQKQGRRLFVERIRTSGSIVEPTPDTRIRPGDEIVLSGRREFIIGDEQWIGSEVADVELLSFPAEEADVTVSKHGAHGMTIDQFRKSPTMYGVIIKRINRAGTQLPVLANVKLQQGDIVTLIGLPADTKRAVAAMGYADIKSNKSDIAFIGLAIFIGGLVGALTLKLGSVPVSLSTSGGALISGLFFGWLRSKRPTFGAIPKASVWLLDNLGLNMFIAVVGITSGPSFVHGLSQVGWMLFVIGALATALPLIIGIIIGKKIFKFPAAVNLGCVAGSRVTTASLGAIQDALGSTLPAMGYTITYAIGNTLLILWGVVLVLLMA